MAKQSYIYDGTQWVPVGSQAVSGTSANIINTVVQRDSSGNFSAGTINGTIIQMGSVSATSANIFNALVIRDGSGNFNAGTISAYSLGSATTISATGDVSGANVVSAGQVYAVSPNAGSAGGVVIKQNAGGGLVYLQFVNNANNAQYGVLSADSSGNMTVSPASGVFSVGSYKAVRDLTNNNGQIQHGVVSSTATIAAGGSMFIPYTFPVAFAGTPNVTMTYNSGTGGSVYIITRVLAITSSGANFYFYNATTAAGTSITHQAQWIGIY